MPWFMAVSREATEVETKMVSLRPTSRMSFDACSKARPAIDTYFMCSHIFIIIVRRSRR